MNRPLAYLFLLPVLLASGQDWSSLMPTKLNARPHYQFKSKIAPHGATLLMARNAAAPLFVVLPPGSLSFFPNSNHLGRLEFRKQFGTNAVCGYWNGDALPRAAQITLPVPRPGNYDLQWNNSLYGARPVPFGSAGMNWATIATNIASHLAGANQFITFTEGDVGEPQGFYRAILVQ